MPVAVTRLLIVKSDYSWICQINGLAVPSSCSSLTSVPDILTIDDFSVLLTFVATTVFVLGTVTVDLWNFVN